MTDPPAPEAAPFAGAPPATPDELRAIRRALRLTQPRMAAALGLSLRALKSYELGERPVPRLVGLAALGLVGVELSLQPGAGGSSRWRIELARLVRRR